MSQPPPPYTIVAAADTLAVGEQREFIVSGTRILVYRSNREYFAVQALCTHMQLPLLGAKIEQCALRCPHHAGKFDVRDGRALEAPAFRALRCYPLRIKNGYIEIAV